MVERNAEKVKADMPSLVAKRVSPHSIRHVTATHGISAFLVEEIYAAFNCPAP
jgi:hypothetical protein